MSLTSTTCAGATIVAPQLDCSIRDTYIPGTLLGEVKKQKILQSSHGGVEGRVPDSSFESIQGARNPNYKARTVASRGKNLTVRCLCCSSDRL